jgi:hypothetical protein
MEEKMDEKRIIHKLSSVIDLLNHDTARSMGKPSIRVRYDYDGINNHEEFTVLNHDIPKESAENIVLWLKENVKSEDILSGIESNRIDVESFSSRKKAA